MFVLYALTLVVSTLVYSYGIALEQQEHSVSSNSNDNNVDDERIIRQAFEKQITKMLYSVTTKNS